MSGSYVILGNVHFVEDIILSIIMLRYIIFAYIHLHVLRMVCYVMSVDLSAHSVCLIDSLWMVWD